MKKLLSIILTAAVILSAIVFSIPSIEAASDDTLTITSSIYYRTGYSPGEWVVPGMRMPICELNTTYSPIEVKVGDVIEVSVDMKSDDKEIAGTVGIDIKTFFSGGSFRNIGKNDGTLTYTDTYYDHCAVANVPTLGNTVTAPEQWDAPDPTRSHFGYTDSSAHGVGNWSDWKNLYNFTLSVNKPGITDLSTYIIDVNSEKGFGKNAYGIYDLTLFDYRMSIKVVDHIDPSDIISGDANGDGKVTIDDVTEIQSYLAKKSVLNIVRLKAANVTGSGIVNIDDATRIQMYLAKRATL